MGNRTFNRLPWLRCFALAGFLGIFSLSGFGEELCTNQLIRVTEQREAGKVHFFVQNLQSVEVTVTFELDMTNLTANVVVPYTQVFFGNRTTKAFTLSRSDPKVRGNYHYKTSYTYGNVWAKHDDKSVYALPYE